MSVTVACVACGAPVGCDQPLAPVVCLGCVSWANGDWRQALFIQWQRRDVYTLVSDRIALPNAQMMTIMLAIGSKVTSPRFVCVGCAPSYADLEGIEHGLLDYTPDALAGVV